MQAAQDVVDAGGGGENASPERPWSFARAPCVAGQQHVLGVGREMVEVQPDPGRWAGTAARRGAVHGGEMGIVEVVRPHGDFQTRSYDGLPSLELLESNVNAS